MDGRWGRSGRESQRGASGLGCPGVRPLGKLKMAVMSVAVPLAILRLPGAGWLLILACALTVASAWPYLMLAGAVLKGDPLKRGASARATASAIIGLSHAKALSARRARDAQR